MPLQNEDLFENATQIAEAQIRHARTEQSALFWDIIRVAIRALIGKDRNDGAAARVPARRNT